CDARRPSPVARGVAPTAPDDETIRLGLLLPYAPLHALLLAAARRPLVMTSANESGAPLVYQNHVAVRSLRRVADRWLLHDRDIATPADDSVAQIVAGAPMILRRSRGYVP